MKDFGWVSERASLETNGRPSWREGEKIRVESKETFDKTTKSSIEWERSQSEFVEFTVRSHGGLCISKIVLPSRIRTTRLRVVAEEVSLSSLED